jgi:hypothetical protein
MATSALAALGQSGHVEESQRWAQGELWLEDLHRNGMAKRCDRTGPLVRRHETSLEFGSATTV